jgi:hypothetical protein
MRRSLIGSILLGTLGLLIAANAHQQAANVSFGADDRFNLGVTAEIVGGNQELTATGLPQLFEGYHTATLSFRPPQGDHSGEANLAIPCSITGVDNPSSPILGVYVDAGTPDDSDEASSNGTITRSTAGTSSLSCETSYISGATAAVAGDAHTVTWVVLE